MVCARLLLPSASDTESALLQRVERIETRMDMSIPEGEQSGAPKQYSRKSKAPEPQAPQAAAEPKPAPAVAPEAKAAPEPRSAPELKPALEPTVVVEPTPMAQPKVAESPAEPPPEPKPASPPPVRQPSDPIVAAPPPAAITGEPNAAAVRSMWTTVREKVRQRSRTTEVMLAGAIVRAVEGDTLVLSHESAPLAKRLTEQRNADVIREALKDALGVDWKIRCEAGPPGPPPAPEPEEPAAAPRRHRRATMTTRRACWPRPAATPP